MNLKLNKFSTLFNIVEMGTNNEILQSSPHSFNLLDVKKNGCSPLFVKNMKNSIKS